MRRLWLIFPMWLLSVTVVAAQPATCQPVIQQALEQLGQNCRDLNRNEACYGNFSVRADFREEMPVSAFSRPADVVELATVETLRTGPLDIEREEWGMAVMNAQADIPATLPGQAVVFLLMGDIRLEDASADRDDRTPMQAFYFSGGVGAADCEEAPSTVAIRSPEDITVNLSINGLDITLGSLITLVDKQTNSLTITVHEGAMVVVDTNTIVPVGQSVDVSLNANGDVSAVGNPRPATPNEIALASPVERAFATLDTPEAIQQTEQTDETPGVYVVQPGDSMFRIALDNGTCVSELARVNNIPESQVRTIVVGQELVIPDGSTCGPFVNDVGGGGRRTTPQQTPEVTNDDNGGDPVVTAEPPPNDSRNERDDEDDEEDDNQDAEDNRNENEEEKPVEDDPFRDPNQRGDSTPEPDPDQTTRDDPTNDFTTAPGDGN